MKKYITTDKAKILQEKVIIEQDSINPGLYFVSGWKSVYSFNDDAIETMLRLDELKEIQEPKWTDCERNEYAYNIALSAFNKWFVRHDKQELFQDFVDREIKNTKS